MKSKLLVFLKEKKDLLIFMGVLVLTFISVVTIASIATNNGDSPVGGSIEPTDGNHSQTTESSTVSPTIYTFAAPISGEYKIVREFFDLNNEETLEKAVMSNGTTFVESRGVSYAMIDNTVFDVLSVYPGAVKEVSGDADSLEGYTIVIEHSDGVVSRYSSLSSVSVSVGDNLTIGQKIGTAGTSINDLDAGLHVHLELMQNGEYINPTTAIGKQTSELVAAYK